jgi:hypothetical protein
MEHSKKKLRLEDIKVVSFQTSENDEKLMGGTGSIIQCTIILGSCKYPCTDAGGDGPCTIGCQGPTDPVAIQC